MLSKLNPISVHAPVAPGTLLTGTLTRMGGDATTSAVKLGDLTDGFFSVDYTPAGAASRMIVAVELSGDVPGTALASVAHWERVPMADPTTLSSGRQDVYADSYDYRPHPSGVIVYCVLFNARKHHFARILLADFDGAGAPGSITAIRMGGTVAA